MDAAAYKTASAANAAYQGAGSNAVPTAAEPTTSATVLTRLERAVGYAQMHRDNLRKIADTLGGEQPPSSQQGADGANYGHPALGIAGLVGDQHTVQNDLSDVMDEIGNQIARIQRLVGQGR